MKPLYKRILLFTVVFGGLRLAAQAQSYDNSAIGSDILQFGNPPASGSATFGQTFTAPNAVLDDWTFYLKTYLSPAASLKFQFDLMGWNGSAATGPVLYQSAPQTLLTTQSSYAPFTVNPNLTLTPNSSYVMFINESGLNGTNSTLAAMGASATTSSPLGGEFVYLNNGDNFSEITSGATWSIGSQVGGRSPAWNDTAYKADFSPVPEPSTSSMIAVGGVALLGMMMHRKKHRVT